MRGFGLIAETAKMGRRTMKSVIWFCIALLIGGISGWKARDGQVAGLERQVHDWSGVAVDAEFMMPNLMVELNLGNYQTVWLDRRTGKIFWCPSVDDCKWRDRSEVAHLAPYHPYYVPGS